MHLPTYSSIYLRVINLHKEVILGLVCISEIKPYSEQVLYIRISYVAGVSHDPPYRFR